MYILAEIVENKDLYRNKEDFWKHFKQKKLYFLTKKILYFISKSAKCIFWKICNEIVKSQDLPMENDDFWKKYLNKKFVFYDLKDFICYKYICKMNKLYNIKV